MSKNEEKEDYGIELVDSSEEADKRKAIQQAKKAQDAQYKALKFEDKIKTWRFWKYIVIVFLWLVSLKVIEKHTGFGSVFLAVSIFVAILMNLEKGDRKPGELSAYSIFNDGAKRIIGDNPDGFLASFGIRSNSNNNEETKNEQEEIQRQVQLPKDTKEWMKQVSKMGNKPCYCGSLKKYKKCCYWRELRHLEDKKNADNSRKRQAEQDYFELEDED